MPHKIIIIQDCDFMEWTKEMTVQTNIKLSDLRESAVSIDDIEAATLIVWDSDKFKNKHVMKSKFDRKYTNQFLVTPLLECLPNITARNLFQNFKK